MKMKYGGPDNGRPMLGKRANLKKAKVAEMTPGEKGRHYLTKGSANYEANGPLTHIPSMGAEIKNNKRNRKRRTRNPMFEDRPAGVSQGPKRA